MKDKIQIREATLDDAPKMLDFVKAVASETDFLILDEEDVFPSVDEERAFILSCKKILRTVCIWRFATTRSSEWRILRAV